MSDSKPYLYYLMTYHPITQEEQPLMDELKDQEWPHAELTINYDDGWLRFDPGQRMGKELFALIAKKVLTWKRGEQKFAGPWTPGREDFFREYFGVEMELDETDLLELAEERAAFFQDWSQNAYTRSKAAYQRSDDIVKHIPMGQPILVGHHSEKHHRRHLAQSNAAMRQSVDEQRRAEKWEGRAQSTLNHAAARYGLTKISRRIQELQKEMRAKERELDEVIAAGGDTTRTERWLAYYNGRLEVAYQLLKEVGGDVEDPDNPRGLEPEVGGAVFYLRKWYPVIRVNKKSVTIGNWLGVPSMTFLAEKNKIKKVMSKADWEGVNDDNQ